MQTATLKSGHRSYFAQCAIADQSTLTHVIIRILSLSPKKKKSIVSRLRFHIEHPQSRLAAVLLARLNTIKHNWQPLLVGSQCRIMFLSAYSENWKKGITQTYLKKKKNCLMCHVFRKVHDIHLGTQLYLWRCKKRLTEKSNVQGTAPGKRFVLQLVFFCEWKAVLGRYERKPRCGSMLVKA